MKKYSLALIASLTLITCKNKNEIETQHLDINNKIIPQGHHSIIDQKQTKKLKPEEYPVIVFEKTEHNFGNIQEGDKVTYTYKFKNTGKNDLYILEVKPSCGCTAPEWTKTPIKKGKTGEIKIIFNSKGKSGETHKTIALLTNTMQGNETISFKANINKIK